MGRKATKPMSQQLREVIDASGMSRYRICKEIGLDEGTMSRFMASLPLRGTHRASAVR